MTAEHHRISPLDLAWLFVESDATPMHVGSMLIFDARDYTPERIEALYAELIAQPAQAAPFNLRMHKHALSLPEWERVDEVDMEYHVQRWAVPRPGNDAALHALIEELHSEQLDFSKPLWEFHLIEGLSDSRIAVYIKIHHSIMDGIAGLSLMNSMMQAVPAGGHVAPWSADSAIAQLQIVHAAKQQGHGLLNRMRRTFVELKQLPDVARSLRNLAWAATHRSHSDLQAAYTAPASLLNHRVTKKRRFAGLRLELSAMRSISAHAGVTINDVLLSCCSAGLRAYLDHCRAAPAQSLLAGIPISLREPGDVHMGTALSFLVANLATDETDPRERLAKIHASTRAAKAHLRSMPPAALTEYTLLLMAPYMGEILSGLAGRVPPAFNIIISNVPGPQETLHFGRARLLSVYPLSIVTHGQGLNITVLGYQDHLHLGMTACGELPRLEPLLLGMQAELDRLQRWAEHLA